MKKIAVLSPVHRRTDLLIEQLNNYNVFFGNKCHHILHPSIEGRSLFCSDFFEKISHKFSFEIVEKSQKTSWKTIMGAFIECSKKITDDRFDYVYLHTDADLLVKGDLYSYIYEKKLGFSGGFPEKSWNWPHYDKMTNDVRYQRLRADLGIQESAMLIGRQEGSFFPVSIWLKIVEQISFYYKEDFFDNDNLHWPIEEGVIPTLAKHFTKNTDKVKNVIHTKELIHSSPTGNARDNIDNCINIEDLVSVVGDIQVVCAGLKWFSQDINDPAREFLKNKGM